MLPANVSSYITILNPSVGGIAALCHSTCLTCRKWGPKVSSKRLRGSFTGELNINPGLRTRLIPPTSVTYELEDMHCVDDALVQLNDFDQRSTKYKL